MAKRNIHTGETPELFETASNCGQPSEYRVTGRQSSADRRHILPNDLSSALSYLSEDEFQALVKAVNDERDRRISIAQVHERGAASPIAQKSQKNETAKMAAPPLTQTRLNAIRAAIKAG